MIDRLSPWLIARSLPGNLELTWSSPASRPVLLAAAIPAPGRDAARSSAEDRLTGYRVSGEGRRTGRAGSIDQADGRVQILSRTQFRNISLTIYIRNRVRLGSGVRYPTGLTSDARFEGASFWSWAREPDRIA